MAKKSAPPATDPATESPPSPATPEAAYTVLARRYRPQTFEELVGHEAVTQTLTNAIKSNRLAHAILFTGTRGVGKTTLARILAKCLNCEKGPTATPCNVCDMCRGITSGDDVDVVEIDAASNTGVDNIRDLRSNTQYRPARARFKIYIIDEVHMLSNSSFAALLKTLEEPPPHVKFFFATTDPQELPAAILSRCQRYELRGFSVERIREHLGHIVKAEGLEADNDALELIARRARGSMRDGQSLLDQLLAFGTGKLTAEQVHRLLGSSSDDRIVALAQAVTGGNAAEALTLLDQAEVQGAQMSELVDQLVSYWRDLMAVQIAGDNAPNLGVAPGQRGILLQQAKSLSGDAVLAGLDILTTTRMRLRDNDHARTLVEMALVRLTRLKELVALPQLAQWLASGQVKVPAAGTSAPRPASPPEAQKKNDRTDTPSLKSALTATPSSGQPTLPSGESLANNLPELWEQVLAQVGGMLAGDLRLAGMPAITGPNTLVLRFPLAYNKAQEYSQRQAGKVEQTLQRLTGRPWTLRIEAAGGTKGAEPAGTVSTPAPPAQPRVNPKEEAEKIPLVRRALDVLEGQIIRADENFGSTPGSTQRDEAPNTEN